MRAEEQVLAHSHEGEEAPPLGHLHDAVADAIVGGVHFLADDPPDLVARKALRVNLSDLAAKGAVPRAYMLDIMLPRTIPEQWIAAFAEGLAEFYRLDHR